MRSPSRNPHIFPLELRITTMREHTGHAGLTNSPVFPAMEKSVYFTNDLPHSTILPTAFCVRLSEFREHFGKTMRGAEAGQRGIVAKKLYDVFP